MRPLQPKEMKKLRNNWKMTDTPDSPSTPKVSNDKEYWNRIYRKNLVPEFPSHFAEFCGGKIEKEGKSILDLGCGNGRDSCFFKKEGLTVFSTDISYQGIGKIKDIVDQVVVGDFTRWVEQRKIENGYYVIKGTNGEDTEMKFKLIDNQYVDIDYFYIRWVWHAINKEGEDRFVKFLKERMKIGARILIEARTRKDPLYKQGELAEEHAYIFNNHFRRFLDPEEVKERLVGAGLKVEYHEESFDFSPMVGTKVNPHLFRMIAVKEK